ncbi:4-alpha-glucanotransferase [Desertihabitans brevis]|nr:4-alpha-glucanotransferase [Desertihabitans brevis]
MLPTRAAGVQLHLTSLPDGRMGPSARKFVDWLAEAGQTVWQVLPVSVPGEFGSPYSSPSAFAASPALLEHPDAPVGEDELAAFAAKHAYWVDSWTAVGGDLAGQVRFDREWGELRRYAADRGVQVMGDVPIYVAADGADHRAWPEIFRTDAVAGVPPDAFSETGQLWGNPLYDWDALAADGMRWWVERLRRTFDLFDLVRIDHFRGFSAYWAVPVGDTTAENGRWVPGPGRAVFDAATRELGPLPVVAEDLGDIDAATDALRRELGLPGMAVLQFAFNPDDPDKSHEPENLEADQVVYTGTHDNDTVVGWWDTLPEVRRAQVRRAWRAAAVTTDGEAEPSWAMVELALAAPCRLAMTQAQDVLGLGTEARMNLPGVAGGWSWRLEPGALTSAHAARLRALTEAAGRA